MLVVFPLTDSFYVKFKEIYHVQPGFVNKKNFEIRGTLTITTQRVVFFKKNMANPNL